MQEKSLLQIEAAVVSSHPDAIEAASSAYRELTSQIFNLDDRLIILLRICHLFHVSATREIYLCLSNLKNQSTICSLRLIEEVICVAGALSFFWY